jgi:thioredoxin-like negative regulator of GroEL
LCLNAEKAPFFIQKLAIRTLPTIVCFIDGVARDRVVGFEDLGGKDEFDTIVLTRR